MRQRVCYICKGPLTGKKRHGFLTQDGQAVYCGDWKMPDSKLTRHQLIKREQRKGLREI